MWWNEGIVSCFLNLALHGGDDQLHILPLVHSEYEAQWAIEVVWMLWQTEVLACVQHAIPIICHITYMLSQLKLLYENYLCTFVQ